MTKGKYKAYLVLRLFGFNPATRLLAQATSELQLMNQAIELLGHLNAQYVSEIDYLHSDYWEITRLRKDIAELSDQQVAIQTDLKSAISQKNSFSEEDEQTVLFLRKELKEALVKKNNLIDTKNQTLEEGRRVRRRYDGLMSEKEQSKEASSEILASITKKIENAALKLSQLKERKDGIENELKIQKERVINLESEIENYESTISEDVLMSYSDVGLRNQTLSSIKNRSSVYEAQLKEKIIHVGRYLFANSHHKSVSRCIKERPELLFQIRSLKESITLAHQFADRRMPS